MGRWEDVRLQVGAVSTALHEQPLALQQFDHV